MFNIYKEEGEEMTENAKLCKLFKRTKHPQLIESVKALEVRYDMDGLTYTQAANHLTTAAYKLPDYQMACRVSNVKTGSGQGSKPTRVRRDGNTIYATDGTIWTGHYDEWATMKDSDKEKITAERERKKKAQTGKGAKGKNYKRKVADITSLTEDIQALLLSSFPRGTSPMTTPPQNHHATMPGMPLGDVPPNPSSRAIDKYPLCNPPIVPTQLYDT